MKIGIFGGSFDPPHKTHTDLVAAAAAQFGLEKIILLPNGIPYYKHRADTPAQCRLDMCRIVAKKHGFKVCDYEILRNEYSYTADTLEFLKTQYPYDELYFILGTDSLDYIDTWKNPEKIFSICKIISAPRPGYSQDKAQTLKNKYGGEIFELDFSEKAVSSSEIRKRIRNGDDVGNDIESEVWQYILNNKLYTGFDIEFLKSELKGLVKPERYTHSLGVMDLAGEYAEKFGADPEKARVAGLLHDCAKNLSKDIMKIYLDRAPNVDDVTKTSVGLWHGPASAEYAKEKYGIDEDIYDAIFYHTIGKRNMSLLTKIVFLADALEVGRDQEFDWSCRLRKMSFENFDAAMLELINLTMISIVKRDLIMHRNSVDIRNDLLNAR